MRSARPRERAGRLAVNRLVDIRGKAKRIDLGGEMWDNPSRPLFQETTDVQVLFNHP